MTLSAMLSIDENALICDFAETYHIYDLESLPVTTVAILACGLGEESRIMRKVNGTNVSPQMLLLAHMVDRLSIIAWQRTKDGARNRNKPASIVEQLLESAKPRRQHRKAAAFDSAESFEKTRKRILERRRSDD